MQKDCDPNGNEIIGFNFNDWKSSGFPRKIPNQNNKKIRSKIDAEIKRFLHPRIFLFTSQMWKTAGFNWGLKYVGDVSSANQTGSLSCLPPASSTANRKRIYPHNYAGCLKANDLPRTMAPEWRRHKTNKSANNNNKKPQDRIRPHTKPTHEWLLNWLM